MKEPASALRSTLLGRGLLLEYITLGWNVIGTAVVVMAAFAVNSVALAGFGLDSLIEIFASVIVIWQLKSVGREPGHNRERWALRLIVLPSLRLLFMCWHSPRAPCLLKHTLARQGRVLLGWQQL